MPLCLRLSLCACVCAQCLSPIWALLMRYEALWVCLFPGPPPQKKEDKPERNRKVVSFWFCTRTSQQGRSLHQLSSLFFHALDMFRVSHGSLLCTASPLTRGSHSAASGFNNLVSSMERRFRGFWGLLSRAAHSAVLCKLAFAVLLRLLCSQVSTGPFVCREATPTRNRGISILARTFIV